MKYVIIDIDGTISKVGDRLKYLQQEPKDWDEFYQRCGEDEPVENILKLLDAIELDYNIVLCTGRRESCRDKTIEWLINHDVSSDYLIMRKDDDYRHDTEVKPELLNEFMKHHGLVDTDIAFILEDRTSMVKKWRELGYTCLQVADGDF